MKKTLVIHPSDRSTDFLKIIYQNIVDTTVITGGVTKNEVYNLIDSHDRIIMMGHGCPDGLFSCNKFGDTNGLIIDRTTVFLLEQKECIFIWCNADMFVKHYGLKGFFSGMFISEVGEAIYCGYPKTKQDEVTSSNDKFAEILSECIDNNSLDTIHTEVRLKYGVLGNTSKVANYNNQRLYLIQ